LIEQETIADVIFEKAGVLRFHSQQDMIDAAIAFSSQPVPNGDRVCIVTNTGGPGIIAVDECMAAGLQLARLSSKTKNTLKKLVFQEAIVSNPVDVVATAGPEQYGGTVAALLKDPNIDSLLLVFVTAPFVDCERIARKLGEIGKTSKKPIVCQVITIEKWQEVIRLIRESGVPVYDYAETAARVLSSMTDYGKIQMRKAPSYKRYRPKKDKVSRILKRAKGKGRFLPQKDVFAILESYGIPALKTSIFNKKEDLLKAAKKIGYPSVLKVDAEELIHKTEVGGVVLNIKDEKSLKAAFGKMSRKFAKMKPKFLLQEYVDRGKEVIMGIKRNESLPPTLMFGLGGVFVETLKDVQFRLAPLSQEDAEHMIRSIKGYPVLSGTRGEKPADVDSLADLLQRLSTLAADFPSIDEMDLNPVLVFEKSKGAVVVDARLKTV
jgi:acetyltransferase